MPSSPGTPRPLRTPRVQRLRRAAVVAGIGLSLLGSPLAPYLEAAATPPPPALVAVVLDTSGSLRPADLDAARSLASGLLRALPAGSEAAVFAFADESQLLLERTSDIAAVEQAISALRPTGRRTALYDALYDASRYLRDAPAARRAMVLLTDGKDEGSALSVEDGLKVAQEIRIPVFGVGVGRVQERVLRRVAKLTAGEYSPIEETTGGSLAARILEAATLTAEPEPASAPSAPAAAAPGPGPDAPGAGTSPSVNKGGPSTTLPPTSGFPSGPLAALLVGLALLVVTVLIALLRRRPSPRPASSPAAGLPRGTPRLGAAQASSAAGADEPATVFARMELGNETVERTVLLREQPVLEISGGPGKGRVFPLSVTSATSVGRAPANDVVLEDESISAQHMRIRPEDGRFVMHDLGSTNGTRVNDRRVARHPLDDGDVIRVGDTSLRFRISQGR